MAVNDFSTNATVAAAVIYTASAVSVMGLLIWLALVLGDENPAGWVVLGLTVVIDVALFAVFARWERRHP